MTRRALPAGVELRRYKRADGAVTETFAVRYTDVDGSRPRRSFDTVDDTVCGRPTPSRASG